MAKFPTVMALGSLSFWSLLSSHRSFSASLRAYSFLQFSFFMQQTLSNNLHPGHSLIRFKAVTNTLYDSGKLASKCTTRSSSEIGSPITDSPIKNLGHGFNMFLYRILASKKNVYAAVATCWPMFFSETDFLAFAIPH